MGVPHMVMKHYDPMIGVDFHMVTIPPAPPAGPSPYATLSLLNGLLIFFTPLPKQHTVYGITVAKGSDIGGGIPHIGPPSVDLPLTIIGSGSKCHFGSANYKVQGKPPGLALAITLNPNLNCGTPVPTPTGGVLCFSTHAAGMSVGDIIAGLLTMAADAAMQAAFNALGNAVGGGLGGFALTFLIGTPLGPGLGNTNLYVDKDGNGWSPGGAVEGWVSNLSDNTGKAVDDYLNGKPAHIDIPDIATPTQATPALRKPSNVDLL
jgi:hypothetical protein